MMTSRWSATATGPATNGLSSGSMTSAYAELHCHSNYSFLEGASHPDELVARARDLEMPALAITDRNGFYGAVKFLGAAQRAGIQPIIGTELTIDDGTTPPKDRVDYDRWGDRLLLLAEDKIGYMSLCRLISTAQMPNAKGMARLPASALTTLRADQPAPASHHLIALGPDPPSAGLQGEGDQPGPLTPLAGRRQDTKCRQQQRLRQGSSERQRPESAPVRLRGDQHQGDDCRRHQADRDQQTPAGAGVNQ